MTRPALLAALLLAALLQTSASVSAQGAISASVVELDGAGNTRTRGEDILDGMNLEDCADTSASITIELSTNPGQVDLWHNDGGSLDCSLAENRLSDPDMRNCVHLAPNPTVNTNRRLTIDLADVLAGDAASGDGADICERNRTDVTLYMLDTDANIEHGDIGTAYAAVTVSIDGQAPSAPSLSGDLSGNRVSVSWDAVSDGQDGPNQLRYVVQVNTDGCGMFSDVDAGTDDAGTTDAGADDAGADDAGAGDAGMTDAGMADAGIDDAGIDDAAMDGMMSFAIISEDETDLGETSSTVNLESLGVAEGGQAGVRVATKDQAGNVGEFSNEICLTRATGIGPCELIEGGCDDGGGCSAAGADPRSALAFLFLLVAWSRRR